ncbi:DNA-binding transcriptional regulator, LysR family [Ferrimonas sediminum]|uniref:DNA-binding transcriptional regulator, LysR family n=1 Tax=Ferrimonas sediminum TaxID=718193 RepID=A0A1G9AG62_9GAMM|nr:LysR family transcriptional regulator [Ferrimonas sediminum]SDK25540.1 DNA-binding transcriptional regulator, LysR family [Ferrimonas sediminum]
MKTEDLYLFNVVVEYGSQREAARVLGIPASKVSRRISQLEQHLGTLLLERTNKGLQLTMAGEMVLERSKRILAEADELELSVGRLQDNPEGTITVAAPMDFLKLVCRSSMGRFHDRFPNLQLKYVSYQSCQSPLEVQADLVLFIGHDTPPDCSMVARRLASIERTFVASPAFMQQHPELVHPRQLSSYPCLLSAKGVQASKRWLWSEGREVHEVEVSGPLDSDINEVCALAAVDGIGVAWVMACMVQAELKQGTLVKLFDGKYSSKFTVWGLYSSRHYMPQRVRIVLDFFLDILGDIE